MSKMILAAGVAALAFAVPAAAGPGGHGGHGPAMQQAHGKGQGADKGPKTQHGQAANAHGGAMKANQGHGKPPKAMAHQGPPAGKASNGAKDYAQHGSNPAPGDAMQQGKGIAHGSAGKVDRGQGPGRAVQANNDHQGFYPRYAYNGRGLATGCPPGLAMKGNGCLPPGQAKKVGATYGAALGAASLSGPYSTWYPDTQQYVYRAGDGVLYRIDRGDNIIDAVIPYGMPDYSYYPVGYTYPSMYNSYNLPTYYQSYYPQGGDLLYRYGGNAIYGVNPQTNLVTSIVSLLAGDLAVGQPLPPAYDVYNVPLAYRSQYADTANDWYRYNDGYIYRVDPTTQLVTAVINALT